MSLHPSAMITQQMGQLSLGNTGAVSGILGYHFMRSAGRERAANEQMGLIFGFKEYCVIHTDQPQH